MLRSDAEKLVKFSEVLDRLLLNYRFCPRATQQQTVWYYYCTNYKAILDKKHDSYNCLLTQKSIFITKYVICQTL